MPKLDRRSVLTMMGATALPAPAIAQAGFPNRPIRLIVPWPAGGATDLQMRGLAEIAARHLRQPIVIENRGGASGTLGASMLATEQRGDGYLISQLPITGFRIPLMSQRPPYDPLNDLTFIIHVTGYLFGVVVRADAPWQDWRSFVAHAKANPGTINYGTPGVGTTLHITMERIALMEGFEWQHVPFRGGADGMQSLLNGATQAHADASGSWNALVEGGRARLLVVWSGERTRRFPNVPTLRETGTDIASTSPYGIVGPKNMDPGVVRVLHDAFKTALYDPAHLALLQRFDMQPEYLDTAAYTARARQIMEEERQMVERLNLRNL
jgi:tripartite-type tricarboxylate transporter receptor subunit TctC